MKSVCCRSSKQKAIKVCQQWPVDHLHLPVDHHFSWDTNTTHDQRANCDRHICVFWSWMVPWRMSDASRLYLTVPQRASFAPSPVSGSRPSVPSPSPSTGWFVTRKPAVSLLFYCYCPQAQWVLSALLALGLPQLKGDIYLMGRSPAGKNF